MSAPIVNVGLVSNIFVRQMHFELTGDTELGHKHNFDHITLLAKGKLKVKVNDQETEYTAPTMIYIRAELNHELTAMSDNTVAYCVHGLRDMNKSDDIIDPLSIPAGSELRSLIGQIVAN